MLTSLGDTREGTLVTPAPPGRVPRGNHGQFGVSRVLMENCVMVACCCDKILKKNNLRKELVAHSVRVQSVMMAKRLKQLASLYPQSGGRA